MTTSQNGNEPIRFTEAELADIAQQFPNSRGLCPAYANAASYDAYIRRPDTLQQGRYIVHRASVHDSRSDFYRVPPYLPAPAGATYYAHSVSTGGRGSGAFVTSRGGPCLRCGARVRCRRCKFCNQYTFCSAQCNSFGYERHHKLACTVICFARYESFHRPVDEDAAEFIQMRLEATPIAGIPQEMLYLYDQHGVLMDFYRDHRQRLHRRIEPATSLDSRLPAVPIHRTRPV